jgi:hypothetical protein
VANDIRIAGFGKSPSAAPFPEKHLAMAGSTFGIERWNQFILRAKISQERFAGRFEFGPIAEKSDLALLQENHAVGEFLRQVSIVGDYDRSFLKLSF